MFTIYYVCAQWSGVRFQTELLLPLGRLELGNKRWCHVFPIVTCLLLLCPGLPRMGSLFPSLLAHITYAPMRDYVNESIPVLLSLS